MTRGVFVCVLGVMATALLGFGVYVLVMGLFSDRGGDSSDWAYIVFGAPWIGLGAWVIVWLYQTVRRSGQR